MSELNTQAADTVPAKKEYWRWQENVWVDPSKDWRSAKILTSGLLGDQYIGLEPGADAANLAAGATITRTQSALVLENLIGQLVFGKAAEAGAAGAKP